MIPFLVDAIPSFKFSCAFVLPLQNVFDQEKFQSGFSGTSEYSNYKNNSGVQRSNAQQLDLQSKVIIPKEDCIAQ